MEALITLVIVLIFIYFRDYTILKNNNKQFSELISIIKQKDNIENDIIPIKQEEEQKDEIVELGDVDPDELLKHLHDDNEN